MGREARLKAAQRAFDDAGGKPYRDCMAEIIGVLKKYDMAGAVTVVSKERAMFKYHFPKWTVVELGETSVRLRSKLADFPSIDAQRQANGRRTRSCRWVTAPTTRSAS